MHRSRMISNRLRLQTGEARVAGSFGSAEALRSARPEAVAGECDLIEIRLDVLEAGGTRPDPALWAHLKGIPLLFTARCQSEGGLLESAPDQRLSWLQQALADADAVDIEVANLESMRDGVEMLAERNIPLVASFHNFERTPSRDVLERKLEAARAAGAAVFKVAAKLHQPADLAVLAEFQAADHGILKSTMGMGPLAPVSRLLCAQYGSVLNYGYLGDVPTAPGQWSAARLKDAIASLAPVS